MVVGRVGGDADDRPGLHTELKSVMIDAGSGGPA